jgi:DNA-binding NtrC family response regulator
MQQKQMITGSSNTILVADGERIVRDVASAILRAGGHKTLQATSAETIRNALLENAGEISLLMVDPGLLGPNAKRILDALLATNGQLALLISSDYARPDAFEEYRLGQLDKTAGYIQKPYTAEALQQAARSALLTASPSLAA